MTAYIEALIAVWALATSFTAPVVETPPAVAVAGYSQPAGALSRDEFFALARTVGFEREHVIAEAYRVACGGGSTRWGESACKPGVENINEYGWFIGLMGIWSGHAPRCGVDAWSLFYPAVNLACARLLVLDAEAQGKPRWSIWEVQP